MWACDLAGVPAGGCSTSSAMATMATTGGRMRTASTVLNVSVFGHINAFWSQYYYVHKFSNDGKGWVNAEALGWGNIEMMFITFLHSPESSSIGQTWLPSSTNSTSSQVSFKTILWPFHLPHGDDHPWRRRVGDEGTRRGRWEAFNNPLVCNPRSKT